MNVDFFRAYLLHPPTARHQQRAAGKLAIVAGLSIDEREATMLLSNYSDDLTKIELMWKGFNWTGGVTAEIRTIDVANDFSDVRTEVVDGEKALIRFMLKAPANRQSPRDGFGQIRRVQERIIKEFPHCYPGADYDLPAREDTTDKVHLSEFGAKKAAQLSADALNSDFFTAAVPLQGR